MRVENSGCRHRSIASGSRGGRRAFFKQIALLQNNLRHPSLRTKKYDEANDIWQARVNNSWRFYFTIVGNTYRILKLLIPHPK